jgi:hypothetical protein
MSIKRIVHAGYLRIDCDHRGCPALEGADFYPGLTQADASADLWARLIAQGWTVWHGRKTRIYCPDHGPSRGSRMRDVTAYYRRFR